MSSNNSQNIQVTIELGHQASFRKKPSAEGYTHDWSVFVRGPEGSKIQHYVEKVVFQLHESFSKPKRVVKEPPYQVSESGYAGFNFPIIIYFRNKESPKKISFDYDLFLNVENSPPINNVRYEKLTFRNPNEEFRLKLLKAGGQPMGNPLALMEPSGTPNSSSKSDSSKKIQKTSSSSKDGSLSSSKEKISKHKSSSSVSSSSSKPSTPMSTPVASKDIRSVTPTITPPVAKEHKSRGKEAQKRPSTSSPPDGETSGKKLKRSSSISSDLGKDKYLHKSDKDKSKNSKETKDESKKKSKHHKSNKNEKKKDKHKHSSSSSEKKVKSSSSESKSSFSSSQNNKKSSESISFPSDIPMKTALLSPLKDSSDDEDEEKNIKKADSDSVSSLSSDLSSSSSSISLSPLPESERKKSNTKFDALMAELGDSDSSDDDFNVKIPVIPPSPPPAIVSKPTLEARPPSVGESKASKKSKSSTSNQSKKSSSKPDKVKSKDSKAKKDSSKSSKESKSLNNKDRETCEVSQNGVKDESRGECVAENGETLSSLWELHDRIMASRDSDMLEEVVNIIQETGLFKVTDTSFDFDLCSVDKETVQKIFKCVSSLS